MSTHCAQDNLSKCLKQPPSTLGEDPRWPSQGSERCCDLPKATQQHKPVTRAQISLGTKVRFLVPHPAPASTELKTEIPWETCPSTHGTGKGPQAPPPAVLHPPLHPPPSTLHPGSFQVRWAERAKLSSAHPGAPSVSWEKKGQFLLAASQGLLQVRGLPGNTCAGGARGSPVGAVRKFSQELTHLPPPHI